MKKIILTTSLGLLCLAGNAQTNLAGSKEKSNALSVLKAQGKLNGNEPTIFNTEASKGLIIHHTAVAKNANGHANQVMDSSSSTACNCWIPRDTTFHNVAFDGSGGSGGPGAAPYYANDDWSTVPITLPFNFCLYGDTTIGTAAKPMFINNNGNITFGSAFSVYSGASFPCTASGSTPGACIAPFWSDVETTNLGSGYVYYQLTPTHLIIQWDSVDCYQSNGTSAPNANLHNTFQLIITDGIDPIIPGGYNVSFCYGDMQWTTGDASSPSLSGSGFGGPYPATVGINKGNGTNYVQVSRFGVNDSSYAGPSGSPASGIDWLSHKSFMFDACGTSSNLPPLVIDNTLPPCSTDTLVLPFIGDSMGERISFIGPEPSQQLTVSVTSPDLGTCLSILSSSVGVTGTSNFKLINDGSIPNGYYHLTVTATDNGTPPLNRTFNYVVQIIDSTHATTGIKKNMADEMRVYPNPSNGSFVVEPNTNEKQLMQVIDVTGKIVLSKNINGKTSIDATNLNEGIYGIRITGEAGIINKRIVIVK